MSLDGAGDVFRSQYPARDPNHTTAGSSPLPQLPADYDDLPRPQNIPHGCTWGIWDSGVCRDQLGMLNQLTPARKLRAAQEIEHGISVTLNWSMENCPVPQAGRKGPQHRILELDGFVGHDDEVEMNTQGGSQWDGFRHWAYQPTGQFYNGLSRSEMMKDMSNGQNGIDRWSSEGGGIAGRGVLLDYLTYAQERNIEFSPVNNHAITTRDLEACASSQGVEFFHGDILLVRTGFVQWHNQATPEEQARVTGQGGGWAGVEGSKETLRWFWSKKFAAVGGDAIVFEVWPPLDAEYRLHDHFLALWGMPIGELFDLETLAT
ncbi:hypothetical protein B0A50_07016 [Salinomyces thailandicus]|uniref:Cyclase n=1 Tax=Salinomyces thailandicus TaxID=706561 RepID=A0A4U0TP88_9PEZI|nr:hypothetical protein B0A50_07016 [Salinomyces thailandica]